MDRKNCLDQLDSLLASELTPEQKLAVETARKCVEQAIDYRKRAKRYKRMYLQVRSELEKIKNSRVE